MSIKQPKGAIIAKVIRTVGMTARIATKGNHYLNFPVAIRNANPRGRITSIGTIPESSGH